MHLLLLPAYNSGPDAACLLRSGHHSFLPKLNVMTDELRTAAPPGGYAGKIRLILFVLFLGASLCAAAERPEEKISIKGENLSLRQIFLLIEKQSDYQFFYNSKL